MKIAETWEQITEAQYNAIKQRVDVGSLTTEKAETLYQNGRRIAQKIETHTTIIYEMRLK